MYIFISIKLYITCNISYKYSLKPYKMSMIFQSILVILVAYLCYTIITNTKSMNKMIEKGIAFFKKNFSLKKLEVGEYQKVLVYKVLPFNSKVYEVDKLGILAVMTMNVGLMEMYTFNINPYNKDLAQLTIDYIIFLNNRKLYVEIYDLMIDKEEQNYKDFLKKIEDINKENADLKDFTSKESWHNEYLSGMIKKSGSVRDDDKLLKIFNDVMTAYIDYAKKAPELNETAQKKKYDLIKDFSDKLVEKGGVAINNFKKTLGDEKTNEFLGNVLYGYKHITS